jgi:hypothetical protein
MSRRRRRSLARISSYDGLVAVFVLAVGYFGHRAHRPRWAGRGMFVYGVGCVLFALPHFVGGTYKPLGGADSSGAEHAFCSPGWVVPAVL